MVKKINPPHRLKYFLAGCLTGITFYVPFLAPLIFLFLLPLYGTNKEPKHFLTFGLGFFTAAMLPLVKAFALITLSPPLTVLLFALTVTLLSLLQFGGSYLLDKLVRFLPLSFTLVEFLREKFLFDGAPYFLIGHLWGYIPFFNLAYCCIPAEGFTFLVFLISYLLYKFWKSERWPYMLVLYGLLTLLGVIAFSRVTASVYVPDISLTVVQPFFKQTDKLEDQRKLIPYLEFLIVQTPKEGLIVLPETVLDYRDNPFLFAEAFPDRDFLMGVQRLRYNSTAGKIEALNEVLLIEKGQIVDRYVKRYLVPFGEYTPQGLHWLARFIPYLAGVDYARGQGFKTFDYKGIKIAPLICNEIFFLPQLEKADLITVLSNDAWFFSPFITYHRLLAKIEAIKTGRVVVFANNNGGSGIFLPNGGEYDCKNHPICSVILSSP